MIVRTFSVISLFRKTSFNWSFQLSSGLQHFTYITSNFNNKIRCEVKKEKRKYTTTNTTRSAIPLLWLKSTLQEILYIPYFAQGVWVCKETPKKFGQQFLNQLSLLYKYFFFIIWRRKSKENINSTIPLNNTKHIKNDLFSQCLK